MGEKKDLKIQGRQKLGKDPHLHLMENALTGKKGEKKLVIYIPKEQAHIEVKRAPEGYTYTVKDWRERGRG